MKLISCEIDLRVGGKYRYLFARDGEKPVAFFGKYTLVERPTRLAWTDEDLVEGSGQISDPTAAASEAMSTLTLDEKHGKTKLILHSRFPSKEALDAIASGVEHARAARAARGAPRSDQEDRLAPERYRSDILRGFEPLGDVLGEWPIRRQSRW
jgi:uncharacterized protein YndB with AHSA1/START domain